IKSLDEIRNLLDTSAIVLVDSEDIYGKKSDFNLARTIESIESFLEIPQEDNFNGLRIIIEILPVTNENTTINTMMEFHSNIDKLISNRNIYFFYLYNEYKFESNTLLDVILIHSRLIFNGYLCKNPLFMNPHQLQLMREDRLDEKLYKKAIYKIVQREIIEQKRVKIDSYIQAEVRNSVNDSIFSLDYKGNILEVNEAIYKTRGYTEEEIIEPVCHGEVRILLVEDDEDVREITKIMLENHGYIVITAENGENALDLYNDSFDLVLTDIIMPIMGGEKLIEMLLEINPQVKCLAMTGYSNVNVPEGVKVLNKPMTTSKLVNYVKNELEQETCQE
ncbi:MAG: response regulator, partial [Candidatus Heimdallarchaeota archaeon]|nr:response regulator [Candidatus Heimdallarchaeota archaeon]MCK4254767.1 response regulator [Candidatus Heimdallarchaeota archaeon]